MIGRTTVTSLLAVLLCTSSEASNIRSRKEDRRELQLYYHTLTVKQLGGPNPDVAIANPLKGLMESPRFTQPPYIADMPLSLEFYYIGLDEVMKANPNLVGEAAAYNWTVIDEMLADSASRNIHAVLRVIVHYPGQPLKIPQYLLNAGVELRGYDGGVSPFYGDGKLLSAFEQFIKAFGKRYDGHKSIGFVQVGLLGFWGEWHTLDNSFIPVETEEKVISWFKDSFRKTKIQIRYPKASAYAAGFGLHDDSFAFHTLDGEPNGNTVKDYYFWPKVVALGHEDFYKRGPMGGETRLEIANDVFEPSYPTKGAYERQPFMLCVNATRATYMFHHYAFKDGGYTGVELANARRAHARMGYNFHVPKIAVVDATNGAVDIDVTVSQIGVAPFYYDLSLALSCPTVSKSILSGVNTMTEVGESRIFSFRNIPAITACLNNLSLTLESSYAYPNRPIKFAQGNGSLKFRLPVPRDAEFEDEIDPLPQKGRQSPFRSIFAVFERLFESLNLREK